MTIHDLRSPGWTERHDIDDKLAVVYWPDTHVLSPEHYGIEHVHRLTDGTLLLVAPRLDKHRVTGDLDRLTVSPSIHCPDCGLHGFLTNGVWRAA